MIYYERFETWEPSFSKVVEDLVGKEPVRKLAVLDFAPYVDVSRH